MSKINKAYNNTELIEALKDRGDIYQSLVDEIPTQDYSDEQIARILCYNTLSQFEKDLLYLVSQHPVTEVASLYGVSKTIIYNKLHLIQNKLKQWHHSYLQL